MDLLCLILLGTLCASLIGISVFFPRFEKFSVIQVNFCPPFSFWDPYNVNVILLDGVAEFLSLRFLYHFSLNIIFFEVDSDCTLCQLSFFYCWIMLHGYITFYLSVDGCLCCFSFLAVINNAVNICVSLSVWTKFFIRVELLGLISLWVFKKLPIFFPKWLPVYITTSNIFRVSGSSHPGQPLSISVFFIMVIFMVCCSNSLWFYLYFNAD